MMNPPINYDGFQMTGARGILERADGAIQIRQQVELIETAIHTQPASVFDTAKALVETVCKTILHELEVEYGNNWDVPQLLRETLTRLRLFPSGHESPNEVTENLKKTVNGLITTVQGLCELRTREGMVSHGREAFSVSLEPVQALFAANAADTVVSFLWNVHRGYSPVGKPERLSYEDYSEFNDRVDELHELPVTIFGLSFNHSEILFRLDLNAYHNNLQEYLANPELSDNADDSSIDEEGRQLP